MIGFEGFDASGWSGDIDFRAAKAAGKQFGFFRVGRGKPDGATDVQGIDLRWQGNKVGAMMDNIKVGGYWRFYPDIDLERQVSRFVTALRQAPGMLAPLVDIEDAAGLGPTALTDWAIQCLNLVEFKCGRRPILYTGKNFYDNNLEYWRLDRWELCIAWQTNGTWREYGAVFWQYKLDTRVPWAAGSVDLQKFALSSLDHHLFQNELLYHFDDDGLLHGPCVWSDKLLPEAGSQGTQPNYISIIHTMVGYLNGTDNYFGRADIGLESTFGVGGRYDGATLDGAIYQWMRLFDVADANYQANAYAMSTETSDGGGNRYLEPWSPKQAESLAQLNAAWCIKLDRPPVLVSRAHSTERGIGHHRQGTDPWRKPGDDYWSPEGNRACPGDTRINQLANEVIPRVRSIVDSVKQTSLTPPVEEIDVQLDEVVGTGSDGRPFTVRDYMTAGFRSTATIAEISERVSDLPVDYQKQFNELANLLYTLYGQARWDELTTWNSLLNKPWAKLIS